MEYVKWIITIISIFFVSSVVIMLFQMNQLNSFQQEVNYQIERHGGLTDQAIVDLDRHVRDTYDSCVIELDSRGKIPANHPEQETCKNPFYLKEYHVADDGVEYWMTRGDDKAGFGTQIHYAIKRPIGSIGEEPFVEPTAIGTSVSRIRGISKP